MNYKQLKEKNKDILNKDFKMINNEEKLNNR